MLELPPLLYKEEATLAKHKYLSLGTFMVEFVYSSIPTFVQVFISIIDYLQNKLGKA